MNNLTDKKLAGFWPLTQPKELDPLIERAGDARLVLLGEASHGTHEYYTWRSAISKRLIEEKGFNFIAVEGDWPDCYRVNRFVKGYDNQDKSVVEVLSQFNRWPTWMWANWEIVALLQWLKDHNDGRGNGRKAGFYGLDVYSLWESMEALIDYLNKTDPPAARIATRALQCFSGFGGDEKEYAINALTSPCRDEVVYLLKKIRMRAAHYNHDPEASLNTTQNASVIVEAERYYRNMLSFEEKTWNIRDKHMMDSLNRILEFHGPQSKGIVWEHNTHVGDARFTHMSKTGMFNIGQLAREQYPGAETLIVGFGSYQGTVMAGADWGAPMQEMQVPEAREGSIEYILHNESDKDRMIIFDRDDPEGHYSREIPHRAIGVVYRPGDEKHNYVPSFIDKRYDVFIYIDQSSALHPVHVGADPGQAPETYPFNF